MVNPGIFGVLRGFKISTPKPRGLKNQFPRSFVTPEIQNLRGFGIPSGNRCQINSLFWSISGVSHFSKTFEDHGDASEVNEVRFVFKIDTKVRSKPL